MKKGRSLSSRLFAGAVIGALLGPLSSYGLPIDFEGAPFEIQLKNLHHTLAVQGQWSGPLSLGNVSGQNVQGARWRASLGGVSMRPQGFQLSGVQAELSVESWGFESNLLRNGFGLNAHCSQLKVAFLPGTLEIPLPQPLTFTLVTEGGRLELHPEWDLLPWIDQVLRPYFQPEAVERSIRVEGRCEGGLEDLAQTLIRARLKDLPNKDPEFYKKMTQDLAREAERAIQKEARLSMPGVPPGLSFVSRFELKRERDALVLRPQIREQDFLSPDSRKALDSLAAPSDLQAVFALSPAALNRFILLGIAAVAPSQGAQLTENSITYTLPESYPITSFASFIGELSTPQAADAIRVRFVMPRAHNERDNPQLLPWISSSGLRAGADLRWTLGVEFLDARTDNVLASRTLTAEFVFEDARLESGRSSFRYVSGRWIAEESEVGRASPEFGISLDWLLSSKMMKDFMEKNMTQALAWDDHARFDYRRLGQASLKSRREAGGYYAEGLVIRLKP